MDLDAALSLQTGQVIWFQPFGDDLETAGPSLVIGTPALYERPSLGRSDEGHGHMLTWVEVDILTPRTVLQARNEELFYREPVWPPF